jgi:acetylornithine deacetylase/succinyl-diaminopimelate desuccinylase-like protein
MDYSSIVSQVIDLAIEIQQIPAPTFAEAQRAEYLQQRFMGEGLQDVTIDEIGNVYGRLPGSRDKPPLVITAHSDTVFPAATQLNLRREEGKVQGPGIGDNALGVAGLFGLLWALRNRTGSTSSVGSGATGNPSLPGDLWLVANVGEEGLGDLGGMRAVVDRFAGDVLAYLVLEGMALGQVYHRALGVQRYRISVRTQGGHSWVDYGRPSAVHELAGLINRLAALSLPTRPRTTLNVGVISGGTSVNSIAASAHLELDLRSEGTHTLQELIQQVEKMVKTTNRKNVQVASELIGQRPAGSISTNHPLIQLVTRTLISLGIKPVLSVGSTDANIPLSRGLPAVCLGLSTGAGAHTLGEFINVQPLALGLEQLVCVVEGAFRDL